MCEPSGSIHQRQEVINSVRSRTPGALPASAATRGGRRPLNCLHLHVVPARVCGRRRGGGGAQASLPFSLSAAARADQGSRRGPGCLLENPVQFGTVRWSLLGQCGACSSQSRGLRRAWAPSCLEAPKSGCRQNCARSWLLCPRLPSSRMSPRCACSGGPCMVPSPTCACCLSDCGGQRRPRPTRFRPCLLQPRQPGVQRPGACPQS